MSISMSAPNAQAVSDALRNYGARAEAEFSRAIDATGLELRGDIVRRIQRGPATGRVYQKYNPRRTHTASGAGESPATDTGRLASGTRYERESALSVLLSSTVEYGAMLEFGTSTISPRPAWRPAVEAMLARFAARMNAAAERAAR